MKNSRPNRGFKNRDRRPKSLFRAPLAAAPTASPEKILPVAPDLAKATEQSVLTIDCGTFETHPATEQVSSATPQLSPAQKIILDELQMFHRDMEKLFARAKLRMMLLGLKEGAASRK